MDYHKTVSEIRGTLDKNNVWYETFEHGPVRTSEEAAKIRTGYSLHQGAKAMIVRIKSQGQSKFIMAVLPGDLRIDSNKLKRYFNAKDIRFANEEEVNTITNGVQPGGVPPIGNLFNLEVVADPSIFENERIVFNAGDRRYSIAMKSEDYKKIVNPKIESIVQQAQFFCS
jgi:Ala-tRNA(Pro) deacylase